MVGVSSEAWPCWEVTPTWQAGWVGGLAVIDISNPANPQKVGGCATSGLAWGVAVSGHYAYLADYDAGLHVIDISDASNPRRVGGYDTSGIALAVTVSGDYAYVADEAGGLQVIDITDPANPHRVGGHVTSGAAWDVTVSGNFAYVAVRGAGLEVFDISEPTNPQRVGGYDTRGDAVGVAVSGDFVYVADASWGLQILRNPGLALSFQHMGNALSLVWPASATGFVLQSATTLDNGGDWQNMSAIPTEINGKRIVSVNVNGPGGFFRLRRP